MNKSTLSSACWQMGRDEKLISYEGHPGLLDDNSAITHQRQALAGKVVSYEQEMGQTTYLVTVTPIKEGDEVVACKGMAMDISAYKIAEHEMASLQLHTESILKSVGEGIYGINLDGEAEFVNPAAEHMTGWTAEETIGKQIHYMHHHSHPDGSEYPHHECPIYAAIKDGEVHHDVDDEVFWRKDGTCFPVEYTSTPVYEGDKLVGAVAVFKDISERKRAEAELLKAFREVEQLKEQLQEQNTYLQEEIREDRNFGEIIGSSDAVRQMLQKIKLVAETDATVLVLGESGTGKELIAHAIHDASPRCEQPLIKVNCGAISAGLVESELFGHEKGAFTGAVEQRKGRFELADGGTLFLDEVGELPAETQVKLLRVLQEQEFERVGSAKPIKVNVRIIAATNRDLANEVQRSNFREDLFYRLNVFPIDVPSLRERVDDIPMLANHFLSRAVKKFAKPLRGFKIGVMEALQQYRWPGNIRELQNVIERAAILATGSSLDVEGLLPEQQVQAQQSVMLTLEDVESAHIRRVLEHSKGIIAGPKGAALILGMHPNTLRSRMVKLGITL